MKWILAQNCPCCTNIKLDNLSTMKDSHMAFLTNEDGTIVKFDSKSDADYFVQQIEDDDLEDILIIPEIETLGG
jgi:hypothetical protein